MGTFAHGTPCLPSPHSSQMTSQDPLPAPQPAPDPNGAFHADLQGASNQFRFRPERLEVSALEFDSTCSFRANGRNYEDLQVVDVSSTGLGLQSEQPLDLEEGREIEDVRFRHRGRTF